MKGIKGNMDSPLELDCEDDGDYATLRVGSTGMKIANDDNASEENKVNMAKQSEILSNTLSCTNSLNLRLTLNF